MTGKETKNQKLHQIFLNVKSSILQFFIFFGTKLTTVKKLLNKFSKHPITQISKHLSSQAAKHIKLHHRKYFFGIFGGRAIFKTIFLILTTLGIINFNASTTLAQNFLFAQDYSLIFTNPIETINIESINIDNASNSEKINNQGLNQAELPEITNDQPSYKLIIESGSGNDGETQILLPLSEKNTIITHKDQITQKTRISSKISSNILESSSNIQNFSVKKLIINTNIDLSTTNGLLQTGVILQSTENPKGNITKVIIPADTQFKNSNGDNYNGIIQTPKFIDSNELKNKPIDNIITTIQVGSDDGDIIMEDLEGNTVLTIIQIPTPGTNPGEQVNIYFSQNKKDWQLLQQAEITLINNEPYVIFTTSHFTIFTVGSIIWDNLNFLNSDFWDNGPTSGDIVKAIFGSGQNDSTAYNKLWSGNDCNPANISIQYISNYTDSGANQIPDALLTNTIYVLQSGSHITTREIRFSGNCSAILGDGNTILYSTGKLTNGMLNTNDINNIIIDNIKIDGSNDGLGGTQRSTTNANSKGIYFSGSINNTINNTETFKNSYGIQLDNNLFGLINNCETYNNGASANGIYILNTNSNNNTINNTQSYNNGYGIYVSTNAKNTNINNSQFYNNTSDGIYFLSSTGTINNSISFNNGGYGLRLNTSTGNILNNFQAYNNALTGIQLVASTSNNYYGNLKLFNNGNDNIPTGLTSGSANDYSSLGWTTGTTSASTMSRNYLTNPLDANNYLLNWLTEFSSLPGKWGSSIRSGNRPIKYSRGGREALQIQPIRITGDNLTLYGTNTYDRNTGQFLGSTVNQISGSLDISGLVTYTSGIMVTFTSAIDVNRKLFGDIYQEKTGTISAGGSITTGLFLSGQIDIKNVFIQFRTDLDSTCSGGNCGTTHYADTIEFVDCANRWDNNYFITSGFRTHDPAPTTGNIICALYGNQEDLTTAYTQYWDNWNGQCNVSNMTIEHLDPGTGSLPLNLTANTIYALKNGNYITTGTINLSGCTVIIGKTGNINLYSSTQFDSIGVTGRMLFIKHQKYTILDHITIDGTGNGLGGSHAPNRNGIGYNDSADNNTSNNIQSYNNNTYGIVISNSSKYNQLNNIQTYNNGEGIVLSSSSYNTLNNIQSYNNGNGIILIISKNNQLNNIQAYNNQNIGIELYFSGNNNVLNNIHVYNNYDGIRLTESANNILNNIQTYNNSEHGIWIYTSSDNLLNNIRSYNNNSYGIYLESDSISNRHYGTGYLSSNTEGDIGGSGENLTAGTGTYNYLGWTTGTRITGQIMSRDFITNPIDKNGNYMLNRSGTFASLIGYKPEFISIQPITYSYGSGTLIQIQPVIRSGTTDIIASGSFMTGNFIGSDIAPVTGDMQGISAYTNTGILTVTGISANPLITTYSIFGDITTFRIGQEINTSTGIILITGLTANRIIGQLYNPASTGYWAMHFQKDTILDNTPPSQVILISPASGTIINTGTVSLIRSTATDTGIGISGYYYQLSTNTDFGNIILSGTKTTTGIDLNFYQDNIYYRHVYAINNIGNTGAWSDTRDFLIDTTPPNLIFTGSTPANLTVTGNNFMTGQIQITETNLSGFLWNWNGTNYTGTILTYFNQGTGIYSLTNYADTGLILAMNFDNISALGEATGAVTGFVKDLSTYNNNGITTGGMIWTGNGKFGGAYKFDGTNDYVNLGTGTFGLHTGGTISVWINASYLTDFKHIFSKEKGNTPFDRIMLRITDQQKIQFIWDNDNYTNRITTDTSINIGTWYHIVATADPTNNLRLFIDGSLVMTGGTFETFETKNYPVYIGLTEYDRLTDMQLFSGIIDDIRIYNRALSSGEIQQLYNSSLTKYDTGKRLFTTYLSGLADGTYNYYGLATDTLGQTGSTETRSFTVDTTRPSLIFTGSTPADLTVTGNNFMTGQIQITETNLSGFLWNWNNISYTTIIYPSTNFYSLTNYTNTGLILAINFDNILSAGETTGIIIKDRSTYGNNGTGTNNPARTGNGKFGGSYIFNGTNNYINIGNNNMFNITGDITISFRLKIFDTNYNAGQYIIERHGAGYIGYGVRIYLGKIGFWTNGGGRIESSGTINNNQWHLITIIGKNNSGYIYIDNNIDYNFNYYQPGDNSDDNLSIGYSNNASGYFFSGLLDEIRIRNYALTSLEIQQHYNSNLSKYDTGKRLFTTYLSGLADGTYNYFGCATDMVGLTGCTEIRDIQIDATSPNIIFTGSTPADLTVTGNNFMTGQIQITEMNLSGFLWNWNGLNYIIPIYTNTNSYSLINYDDTGLVLAMNFDNIPSVGETTGGIIKDRSIYNNTGTATGVIRTGNGKYAGSYIFSGIDNYIQVTGDVNLNLTGNSATFMAWIKAYTAGESNYGRIITKFDGTHSRDFFLGNGSSAYLGLKINGQNLFSSGGSLVDNQWHQVTATYQVGIGAKFYIDGIFAGSDSSYTSVITVSNVNVSIGQWVYLSQRYFNGQIDDIRLYNNALSSGEIWQYYNFSLSKYDTGKRFFTTYLSGLADGTYNYYGLATDIIGRTGSTEIRSFTVDTTGPNLIFTGSTPADLTITGNNFMTGQIQITETNLSGFLWNWNGTNYTGTILTYFNQGTGIYSLTNYADTGLILAMNFDNISALGENTGTIKDLSLYGNNGTVNGAIWTGNGKFNGTYKFDGINNYIEIQENNDLDYSNNQGTIKFWFKFDNTGHTHWFISKKDGNSWSANGWAFVRSISEPQFQFCGAGSNYAIGTSPGGDLNWHFLAVSFNNGTANIYLDGNNVTTDFSYSNIINTTNNVQIGRLNTQSNNSLEGQIDEFRLYNRALSSLEIQQLYNSSLTKYDTGKRLFTTYLSGLADGTYNYFGCATDMVGLTGCTETRDIQIDATSPNIIFTGSTPADLTVTGNNFMTGQIQITETNLSGFLWNWNGTNYTGTILTYFNQGTGIYSLTNYADTGLVLAMNFDNISTLGEATGAVTGFVKDLSTYNNNGITTGGMIWTGNGKFGGTYNFDGSNDYLTITNNLSLNFGTGDFSISTRFKTTKTTTEAVTNNYFNNGGQFGLYIGYPTSKPNKITFYTWKNAEIYTTSNTNVTSGIRHHVAGTRQDNILKIYIDGNLENTTSGTIQNVSTTNNLIIGGYGTNLPTWYFDGSIDELRIRNRALTSGEIKNLYNSTLSKYDTGKRLFTTYLSGLADGTYNYYGLATDGAGQTGYTETRSFTVDTTGLNLIFTGSTPANKTVTGSIGITGATIQIDTTENNLQYLLYNRNSTNYLCRILNNFAAIGTNYTCTNYADTGLIAAYNLDNASLLGEVAGSTVKDFSIYNHTGTVYWAKPTIGKLNNAYNFNGSSDHINVNNLSGQTAFTGGSNFSLMARINGDTFAVNGNNIISRNTNACGNWFLRVENGKARMAVQDLAEVGCHTISAYSANLSTGTRYFLVGTYDGSAKKVRLYLNSILIDSGTNTNITGILYSTNNVSIGKRDQGPGDIYFDGKIDEVRIYNRVLSSGEISDLYLNGEISQFNDGSISKYNTGKRLFTISHTGLTDNTYLYYGCAQDLIGLTGCTETRSFTIDTLPPTIIFTGSTTPAGSISGTTITGMFDITEINLYKFIYSLNDTDYTSYFGNPAINYSDIGLVLAMNFDDIASMGENTGTVKDFSTYNNTGIIEGGVIWTRNSKYGGAYDFDGNNDYIEINENGDNFDSGLSGLTLEAWVWFDSWGSYPGIITKGDGDSSTLGSYLLYEYNGKLSYIGYSNNSRHDSINTGGLLLTTWQHVAVTWESNKAVYMYINGVLVSSKTGNVATTIDNTNYNILLGTMQGGTNKTKYPLNGKIDEVRIFRHALSSGEILQQYNSNLNQYTTGKRTFTTTNSCLPDGIFTFSGTVTDINNQTATTGRSSTITLPPITLGVPLSGFNFPTIKTSSTGQTIEKEFTGSNNYFSVDDTKGYTGRYTTIQLSGDMIPGNSTNYISGSNVLFKATGDIITISGSTITNVSLAPGITGYQAMTGIRTYIQKTYGPNCSSCILGNYGNNPAIKINVPAYQTPDIYHGTLIFTIY